MRPRAKKGKGKWNLPLTPEMLERRLREKEELLAREVYVNAGRAEAFIAVGLDDDARALLERLDHSWVERPWSYLNKMPGFRPGMRVLELPVPAEPELHDHVHPMGSQAGDLEEWLAYRWLLTGSYDLDQARFALELACRHLLELHRLMGKSQALHTWLFEELKQVGFCTPEGRETILGEARGQEAAYGRGNGLHFPSAVRSSLKAARLLLNLGLFPEARRWLVGTTYLLFLSLDPSRPEPRMSFPEFLLDPAARTAEIDRRGKGGEEGQRWLMDQVRMLEMLATCKLKGVPPLVEAQETYSTWLYWVTNSDSPAYGPGISMCLYVLLGRLLCPEVEPFDVVRELV